MSRLSLRLVVSALVILGCASHEGSISDPEEKPEPAVQLQGSIASVQLIQDCPDPPVPSTPAAAQAVPREAMQPAAAEDVPAAGAPMPGAARMAADADGQFRQPCTQSTMQLLLSHDSTDAHTVRVEEVRLLRASDARKLDTVRSRGPSKWNANGAYEPWDQQIPAGTQMNVSYRLGEPDWSKVEKAIGTPDTYAQRYVLEVDVIVAGRKTTLRSPEFSREYPHVVVT